MAIISISKPGMKGGTPVFSGAVEYGTPDGITFDSAYVQQLIVDLGGPLSQSQVDGIWGPISADALKQTAKKYGYLHYPRQVNDYYSSAYTNGAKKVFVRPGTLIPNLSNKRKEMQEAPKPSGQTSGAACDSAVKMAETYSPQLDNAAALAAKITNAYYTTPSTQNKNTLITAISGWEKQSAPYFENLISSLKGCGRTDLANTLAFKKQKVDEAIAKGKEVLAAPTVPAQNREMCALVTSNVDQMYANVNTMAATIRAYADARDAETPIQIMPNSPSISLSNLIAQWPQIKTGLSTAEGQINAQCDVSGYGEKIRVIRETLEDAIKYASDKLKEPVQPEPVPQPAPTPTPPTPPTTPTPAPTPTPTPAPITPTTSANVPLLLGGAALGIGALTLFMVMRRKRPSPSTAGYGYYY